MDPLTGLRTLAGALTADASDPARDHPADLFTALAARGTQETLPLPAPLAELDGDQLEAAARKWQERMAAHADAPCVHLAAGPGAEARLYALDFVPASVARERERAGAYAVRTMGGDLLGDLVAEEVRRRARLVAIDEEAVAFAPYASHTAFQVLLAPRRPRPRFQDGGPTGAALLHDVLARLTRATATDVDVWIRTAPQGAERFCWRMDLVPRAGAPDVLALGTGLHQNPLAPEDAAARLRDL